MPNKLTLRPSGSLDSFTSSDSEAEDHYTKSDRGDFFNGVRRGFKNLGSVSLGSRNRPAEIQTGGRTTPAFGTGSSWSAAEQTPTTLWTRPQQQYERGGVSRQSNREKPLPKTPQSPPIHELLDTPFSPPDFSTYQFDMSRSAASGSRTSTMDSTTSIPSSQMYDSGSAHVSSTYLTDANSSQSSIASSSRQEHDENTQDVTTPRSNAPSSAGPSPAMAQPRSAGGVAVGTPGGPSTHLSGLMCNVHRTTGREPHPLVGATTTILGDKLYVFGGRILSRTRPALTSDLYELDLIRRHWTKLETGGDIPPPRYFHSVCPLGDTKLVCYGGMSPAPTQAQTPASQANPDAQPEVVVMSDIYVYDAPSRTWTFVPTQDTPQGRYAHCMTILPSSATFSSVNAPSSAIQHNPPSANPNQGSIGVNIDGTGGAEMVVVGGQDSANHYIEQISVFNLRSLKWTSTQPLGKSCGAYRSVVAPVSGAVSARIGKSNSPKQSENGGISQEAKEPGSSMLIYSNYNFLDVKLELQIRAPDGTLSEKPMQGSFSPPGLRFPNGGVIDTNFVVSGTYLTSSKQEYALWALDLRTLSWSRIDAGGSVFSQGSWNRGVLWNRRNTFVILGNRKRSLVEDYNHRRINFSNVCMVELEAFGLYDNPRKMTPMSGFVSASTAFNAPSLSLSTKAGWAAGGRSLSKAAEELGQAALGLKELADMDILCAGGERIPVNSRILAKRWGPYFIQLLREGAATQDGNDAATLRPDTLFRHNPSRNSSITITPSLGAQSTSTNATLVNNSVAAGPSNPMDPSAFANPPDSTSLPPASRPRTLYLPHTQLTLQALLHFLYTSSLPQSQSPLCTPQILCSLLQLARPYKVDGLLEAVVERLHHVLDSRNAAAVFNASAMAAGGGRATASSSLLRGSWIAPPNVNYGLDNGYGNGLTTDRDGIMGDLAQRTNQQLRINTSVGNLGTGAGGRRQEDEDTMSAASSVASELSGSEASGTTGTRNTGTDGEVWQGDISAVIGLQKRGLRGLMEGRRLRERGLSVGPQGQVRDGIPGRVGLGIASG
ncbi:hypothetical protein BP5796_03093 [Coleophoma crateriformis]|uniref:BTB domain-containing protein n=1 Tax=Coleophoma crateriformis TaxID=565419 RepID=A0A3D8SM27_9HELO|nr:hypothetical protein BP5796_03093 [Coleophoma crateriformis]